MKKLLLLVALVLSIGFAHAQCTPDPLITENGIYPDTIVNLPHAYAGAAYNTVIQLRTLTDTSSNGTHVDVDDITLDNVSGLPAGFTFACNPANCVFPAGQTKCLALSGNPTLAQVGTYNLIIDVTLHGRIFTVIPISQASQVLGYKIVILGPPAAQFSGTPTTVCSGTYVNFTDASTNEPTSWSWTFTGGTPSTSNLQVPPPIKYTGSGTKTVALTVTSPAGNNTMTKTAYITVNALPTATITPSGTSTICPGSSILLSANTGTNLSYQWIKGGVDIAGATSSTYLTTTAGTYKVRVTKTTGCSKTSTGKVISLYPATATATPSGATTFCSGGSVTLQANTSNIVAWQWIKGVNNISGATNSSYVATTTGTYKVQVTTSDGCTKMSTAVGVNSNPLPTATVTANGSLTICPPGTVTFTAASGAGYTYQWKKGINLVNGATNQQYTATTAGTYRVIVTNSGTGCSKTSAGQVVTVSCKIGVDAIAQYQDATVVYPNPTTSITTIDLTLSKTQNVSVKLFDVTGKLVSKIAEGVYSEGQHQFTFDAASLTRGIYFAVVNTGDKTKTIKVVVEK